MSPALKKWLPPNRTWFIAEVSVVTATAVAVTAWTLFATPAHSTPLVPADADSISWSIAPLPNTLRQRLMESFGTEPVAPHDQVAILATMTRRLATLGLSLENRTVEPVPENTPPKRQRVRLALRGQPADQVQFLADLLAPHAPLRITELDWNAGEGPEARTLAVTVEVYVQ